MLSNLDVEENEEFIPGPGIELFRKQKTEDSMTTQTSFFSKSVYSTRPYATGPARKDRTAIDLSTQLSSTDLGLRVFISKYSILKQISYGSTGRRKPHGQISACLEK